MTHAPHRTRPTREILIAGGPVLALAAAALAATVCWSTPGAHHHGVGLTGLAGYVAMWLVMVVAMMLPTSLPMVFALHRLGRDRGGRLTVFAGAGAGYFTVWTLAGVAAAVADLGVRGAIDTATGMPDMSPDLAMAPDPRAVALARSIGGVVVLLAGVLALTPITTRCLRACRSPLGFVARHWIGAGDRRRQALRIGVAYGASCLGCCAALMAVLVVVGMQDLTLMLALGAVMAWQKHSRHGVIVARTAGIVMIIAGGVVALT